MIILLKYNKQIQDGVFVSSSLSLSGGGASWAYAAGPSPSKKSPSSREKSREDRASALTSWTSSAAISEAPSAISTTCASASSCGLDSANAYVPV